MTTRARTVKLIIRNVIVGDRRLFMVAVPKAITGTGRVRKFFGTKHDAEDYIGNIWASGYVNADFRQFDGENGESSESSSLNYFIGKFLSEIRESKPTWMQARRILGHLGRRFGRRPISSITRENMLDWQEAIGGSLVTKHNYQRVARRFFKWCVETLDDSPIARSPFAKIKRIQLEHIDPVLLTPAQFGACLQYAKQARLRKSPDVQLLA